MDPSFGCSGNRLRPASGVPLSTISPSTRRSALGTDADQAPVRGMSGSCGSYEQDSGAAEDSETTWGSRPHQCAAAVVGPTTTEAMGEDSDDHTVAEEARTHARLLETRPVRQPRRPP